MHRKTLLVVIISGEKVWWVEAQEENEEIFSFPVCFCSVLISPFVCGVLVFCFFFGCMYVSVCFNTFTEV